MPDADFVDDVISFAQTVCPDILTRYCEQAHTITNEYGPKGLSREEAGRHLLSVRRLELKQPRWEVNQKTQGKGAPYLNALWDLKDLENEMANRVVDALKSGALVMQGYDPKLEERRIAAPVLITAKTVLQALDTNSEGIIELKDGSKLFDTRLVRAEATAPEATQLLRAEVYAAITATAAKEGKPLNRATGPKKVQDWWRENVKSDVQDRWRKTKGYKVPTQDEIKELMPKRPRGRPSKNY
jgi:hypothetical protein